MKIAIPAQNEQVAAHFGHCPEFMLANVVDGRLGELVSVPNPGHRPGFLPQWLGEQGVTVVIAGGIGASAMQIFQQQGIEVVVGVQGKVTTALEQYLKGELRPDNNICHH
ncbi:MAG: dinitrogenase iron-molybdenum cofactor [Firmicutes bacterium]|nr:dinitrogenase iron-molybdenum cofactor [Bacillota bacterium]